MPTSSSSFTNAGAAQARVRALNSAPLRPGGRFVLYWMVAARRVSFNFALDRAVAYAHRLQRPLLIFEPLRVGYPWASDRLHRFVLDGMAENQRACEHARVAYYPYVEPKPDAGKGLLQALAGHACVVVTDDSPAFFLPRMVAAAARALPVMLEAVDSNGLLPMRAAEKAFASAYQFRRHVQKLIPAALEHQPHPDPLRRCGVPALERLPASILSRWPSASEDLLRGGARSLAALPIDHDVPPSPMSGGHAAARSALTRFVERDLARYPELHSDPAADRTSRLSPYLHFGHISAHEVFHAVMQRENWTPARISAAGRGQRQGWWRASAAAEAFLDQLVVWRELGYNMCALRPRDYASFASLPEWARDTLEQHTRDPRPHLYSRAQLEAAETHDALWNAAQRQLRTEGWFHNYMRMLWGKNMLAWSRTPRQALARMTAIMDRWSLDGRDPNSYSGYLWVLGRYDRPWPERPIYGKVRAMTSASTWRKFDAAAYIARYAGPATPVQPTLGFDK